MKRETTTVLATELIALALLVGACSRTPSPYEQAHRAVVRRNTALVAEILASHPDVVHEVSGFDGATLLHDALVNVPSLDIATVLINAGADVNRADVTGSHPIHTLCHFTGDLQCLELLIQRGADPEARDGRQETALQITTRGGHQEAVTFLSQKHTGANKALDGMSADHHGRGSP